MSKKFAKNLIHELQKIRYKLDDMGNCEDDSEMIAICQELSADINGLEESIEDKFKL